MLLLGRKLALYYTQQSAPKLDTDVEELAL